MGKPVPRGSNKRDMMMRNALVSLLLVGWMGNAWADTRQTQTTNTTTTESRVSDAELAQQWGLSVTEWQRYQTLMQGIRGSLSPNLSPIETLGVHARTPAERRRYAEMWATEMQRDTARVLAFQREYNAAWQRLYPDLRMFDLASLPGRGPDGRKLTPGQAALPALKPGDRFIWFQDINCGQLCDNQVQALLGRVKNKVAVGLDVFLLNAKHDGAIRQWAKAKQIPPKLVTSRLITLNHDHGTLGRLAPGQPVPVLLHERGNNLTQVSQGR